MFNYDLISCDPSSYPSIICRSWDSRHPLEGSIVYLLAGNNPYQTYDLVYLGENACLSQGYVPKVDFATFDNCSPSFGYGFKYANCKTGEEITFAFSVQDPTNQVLRKEGDCDCWQYVGEDNNADELISNYVEYSTCVECIDAAAIELCASGERTIGYAIRAQLPSAPPEDKGFDECCFENKVLADLSDADPYKNDFTGYYHFRPSNNSTCVFKLVRKSDGSETTLNDDTYGTFLDFGGPDNADLSYIIVDWRAVLSAFGQGYYQVKKEVSTVGISQDFYYSTVRLLPFSNANADNTVRIDCTQDGRLLRIGDFSNTGFKTSQRFMGFFGRPRYEYEQNNVSKRSYKVEQASMSVDKQYLFTGQLLPDCILDELMEFTLLGNELFVSDYNTNNPSYSFQVYPVELTSTQEPEYYTTSRGATIEITLSDRFKDNRKYNC